MLSEDRNRQLTQVGPRTPMGEVLRRHWHPMDPRGRLRGKVRLKAYEVRPKAGLLRAYLGPAPAPELPDWEPFHWANGFVPVVFADVPCNWLQTQEGATGVAIQRMAMLDL